MAKRDELPSTVRITDLDGLGEPFICDCVLKPHEETGLRYATIELYGNNEQHRLLQTRAGDLVRFEHLIEVNQRLPKEPDGLGRILGGSWTYGTSVGTSEIQKVGIIRILRYNTYLSFSPNSDKKSRCGYVFHRHIDGWLGGSMFEISYDGSIKRHAVRNRENNLLNRRYEKGNTYHHYFYTDEEHDKLIRFALPAIEFSWSHERAFDHSRWIKFASSILCFVHGVELRPLMKHVSFNGQDVVTVWPAEIDREPTRHRMEGPILFSDVPAFIRDGLKALVASAYDPKLIGDAVDRYVHATTQVTVEQSFVSGCEAIEALYKIVRTQPPTLADDMAGFYASIKSVSRKLALAKTRRAELNGRLKAALLPGQWPQIYDFVRASRASSDPECDSLVARCQFHRYRSQFVHGGRVASGHEMLVQRDLMEYVFVALFLHLLGDKQRRPHISEILRDDLNAAGSPIRLIQIYD